MIPSEKKQSNEYKFLTFSLGHSVPDINDPNFNRKIQRINNKRPDFEQVIPYLKLKPHVSKLTANKYVKLAIILLSKKSDERRFEEIRFDDSKIKEREVLARRLERYTKIIENQKHLHKSPSIPLGPKQIQNLGVMSLYLSSYDKENIIHSPLNTIFYIYTSFVQIFYSVSDDHFSMTSSRILTPDNVRKNGLKKNDDRYLLPAEIENIETAKSIMGDINIKVGDISPDIISDARALAFNNYKSSKNINKKSKDINWISNVDNPRLHTFIIEKEIELLLLMCVSLRDKKRINSTKRLLLCILFMNTIDYSELPQLYKPRKLRKRTIKPKKTRVITKKNKTLFDRNDKKTNTKGNSISTKKLETLRKKIIEKLRKKNKTPTVNFLDNEDKLSNEYDRAIYMLEKVVETGDRNMVKSVKGSILFWFIFNIGLLWGTTYRDYDSTFIWRDFKRFVYDKSQILAWMAYIELFDYYLKKIYLTRVATIDDLKINLNSIPAHNQDTLKRSLRRLGNMPMLYNHPEYGLILTKNFFIVHGILIKD